METQSMTPERKLIYQDEARIATIQPNLEIAKSILQDAIDAYNSFEGLKALDDQMISNWLNDPDNEIENCRQFFYVLNYASAHSSMGIGQEKGMELVYDKFPDLSGVKAAFQKFSALPDEFYKSHSVDIPLRAFSYQNDFLIVKEDVIEQITESNQFYLEYPLEFAYSTQIMKIIDAINELDVIAEKIHPMYQIFEPIGANGFDSGLNINSLFNAIQKDYNSGIRKSNLNLDVNFFRGLKQHLVQYNKTA